MALSHALFMMCICSLLVLLEGHVEVEGIIPFVEGDADEGMLSLGIDNFQHKVTTAIRHCTTCY